MALLGGTRIVCLQEIKIMGFMLCIALYIIWLRVKCLYFDHSEEKGGVVIYVSPWLVNNVVEWSSLLLTIVNTHGDFIND